MFQTAFTAPSVEATHTGMALLERGATAIEAMVGAAATVAVSYPHMNSLGGDGFWVIVPAQGEPVGILAGGASGASVGPHCWAGGQSKRGVESILTVGGAVAGWAEALDWQAASCESRASLELLLGDAIALSRKGCRVSRSLAQNLVAKREELTGLPGFAELFLVDGVPNPGDLLRNPDLATTLERLCANGLEDFYRGEVAARIARGFGEIGAILGAEDLASYRARRVVPLSLQLDRDVLYNLPAPTQGLASLLILGIYDRLRGQAKNSADHVHLLVEATKLAFTIRDEHIGDPDATTYDCPAALDSDRLDDLAADIDIGRATPWPSPGIHSDTVWMGASDSYGTMVSYIQSLYWEFGSGVVVPGTGLLWTNRGLCFDAAPGRPNSIGPGKVPRHTLNPAAAVLGDGRRMVYGTMGGEGQPQTQAALWWRYKVQGMTPQAAVDAPRWLLGRTWGEESNNLKIEQGLAQEAVSELLERGHDLVAVEDQNEMMGHAGMVVRHPSNRAEAGCDIRSDGEARLGAWSTAGAPPPGD
ncbi:MAG: gamma-glutamyltransferase [Proteobacteria bacterium]|nr:MAG: gamma-glutamyltransferase [Pseudomonadota bacterium]